MEYIQKLKPQQFNYIRHAASQIAGRKAKKYTYNYQFPREVQHRAQQSPFKDLADSSRKEFLQYMKEDGHKNTDLFHAFAHTVDQMHQHIKPHVNAGGSLSGQLKKIHNTLGNLANTARVNISVGADDFLNRIGLRHERRYQDGEISDEFRQHAKIHKDVYGQAGKRKGTDMYDYLREDSTEKYGIYKHKKNGKVVVAFRGTRPKSGILNHDLMKDMHIAAGNVGKLEQMGDYVQMIQNQIKKYGSGNVSLSGYSLGGSEAVHLSQDRRLRSHLGQTIALAPGSSPLDDMHKQKATDHKVSYIYHHNDAVANSNLEHAGANHHVLYSENDPIKSHLFLDRLAK